MRMIWMAAALSLLAGAAVADPVEGLWKTKPDDNGHYGHVEVKPCGSAYCGTLVRAFDAEGKEMASENIGKRIIWDMVPKGEGAYGDGKVWSPDRDKTYNSGHGSSKPARMAPKAGAMCGDQGFHRRKFAMIRRPVACDFSGWNWVPTILAVPMMAVMSPP